MAFTTPRTWTTGELVSAAIMNTHIRDNQLVFRPQGVNLLIDGGGAVISSGSKFFFAVPYDCTVSRWDLLLDGASNLTAEVWAVSYAGFPPVSADNIVGASPIQATSAQSAQDTNPSAWTSLNQGEAGVLYVVGASGVTKATVGLYLNKD